MPVIRELKNQDYHLLVWKITEDLSFFAKEVLFNKSEMEEYGNISHESRKLEWLAARFVQRQLCKDALVKDTWGKPHLENEDGFVSIAHCHGYAAAIYSSKQAVGIDIEPIHDKVQRIAQKFLSASELSFINTAGQTEHLITCWSIKEAIYKWYGKRELSFKENIRIENFELNDDKTSVLFVRENEREIKEVNFERIANLALAHT
ncbi:MAG: 4'-phosphopantetheinyl transferase [Chitinophagales bacterium]|jgi:4'-phosphopantetheinyl transferase